MSVADDVDAFTVRFQEEGRCGDGGRRLFWEEGKFSRLWRPHTNTLTSCDTLCLSPTPRYRHLDSKRAVDTNMLANNSPSFSTPRARRRRLPPPLSLLALSFATNMAMPALRVACETLLMPVGTARAGESGREEGAEEEGMFPLFFRSCVPRAPPLASHPRSLATLSRREATPLQTYT